jgi:lysyl-tRNA synthetase class I
MRRSKWLPYIAFMMCCVLCAANANALEPDERTHFKNEFSQSANAITETTERLLVSLRQIDVTLSVTMADKIKARQDQARDWAKRIADPATNISVEEVEPQIETLNAFNNQLEHIIELSDQIVNAQNPWPQSMQSPAFIRYVSFLRDRINNDLNAVATGKRSILASCQPASFVIGRH